VPIKLPTLWILISLILFLGCLFGPTFCTGPAFCARTTLCKSLSCSDYSGLDVLMGGWLGVLTFNLANMAWLANPLLFLSWVFIKIKMPRTAIGLICAAILFGLLVIIFPGVETDESGTLRQIIRYGFGYYLWILSMFFSFFGALTQNFLMNKRLG